MSSVVGLTKRVEEADRDVEMWDEERWEASVTVTIAALAVDKFAASINPAIDIPGPWSLSSSPDRMTPLELPLVAPSPALPLMLPLPT